VSATTQTRSRRASCSCSTRTGGAANFLSVGQVYLLDNPLLREPLTREHVKARPLGHFGTCPASTSSTPTSTARSGSATSTSSTSPAGIGEHSHRARGAVCTRLDVLGVGGDNVEIVVVEAREDLVAARAALRLLG
jgi:hypothetical protein